MSQSFSRDTAAFPNDTVSIGKDNEGDGQPHNREHAAHRIDAPRGDKQVAYHTKTYAPDNL